jgi:pre-mRNA-splicing factor CWC22
MEQYNNKLKIENDQKGIRKAGGIYVPPHKLRALQQEMMEADPASEAHQRMMWELLRKSINGIVNKVNIANIQNIVVELFNENILRGRGLLARALIKAQMASPNFTHVYSALIAVINTKVPEIGLLVAKRVLIQFRRSFERNNKIVCVATTRMIAHLINQRVLGEYIALQILLILLTSPTEDSVEIACDFMIEVGQILSEITPAGASAIFERFKSLLHEAEIEQKAQYSIENLFAIRKTGFKEHPGVIPELDLVEGEDQITHQLDLEEEMKGEENLNMFKLDPKY